MLFPTPEFALFFVLVFAIAWSLRRGDETRKAFLLAASYVFYGCWDWRFCFLLLLASVVAYAAGLAIASAKSERLRRLAVGLAVGLLLAILGFYKYYGFFAQSLADLLAVLNFERDIPLMMVILPIGISFFTFHGISYIVDVYRGKVSPHRSPLDLLLYMSFFPQLVAGPIVRASEFLPQLARKPRLTRFMLGYGLLLILVGMVKKMVIANWLATNLVDDVFFLPSHQDTPTLLLAAYGYAVQIYCDFSGYSDMAIGTAALLGYRFPENFRQPYRSASLQEFWRRWHISLSRWLRDYLYKPLGGSRLGSLATYRNLFLTMFLGGLWHGAAYTFVIWGSLHGAGLGLERAARSLLETRRSQRADAARRADGVRRADAVRPPADPYLTGSPLPSERGVRGSPGRGLLGRRAQAIAVVLTFHFVTACWIFFRAQDLQTALDYFAGLLALTGGFEAVTPFRLLIVVLPLLFHFTPGALDLALARGIRRWPVALLALFFALGLVVIEWVSPPGTAPFIYFQF